MCGNLPSESWMTTRVMRRAINRAMEMNGGEFSSLVKQAANKRRVVGMVEVREEDLRRRVVVAAAVAGMTSLLRHHIGAYTHSDKNLTTADSNHRDK